MKIKDQSSTSSEKKTIQFDQEESRTEKKNNTIEEIGKLSY